jgi:hypothetical protein
MDSGGGPESVSCWEKQECMAVDGLGNAISLACTAWSSPTPVDASGLLQSVSCEVAFCAAVDDVGHGFVYQYGSWSSAATLPTGLTYLSCQNEECWAVGSGGTAVNYQQDVWESPQTLGGDVPLQAISCESIWFCVAAGDGDAAVLQTTDADDFGRCPNAPGKGGNWFDAADQSGAVFSGISGDIGEAPACTVTANPSSTTWDGTQTSSWLMLNDIAAGGSPWIQAGLRYSVNGVGASDELFAEIAWSGFSPPSNEHSYSSPTARWISTQREATASS